MNTIKSILIFTLVTFAIEVSGHTAEQTETPLITVTGSAKVQIAPDMAEFVFGVETRAASLSDAQAENAQRTKAVLESLKKLGVESKDLQTDEIGVEPSFGENDMKKRPVHFSVSRSITVKIRNLAKFEEALTTALKAGATRVRSSEFQSTELRSRRDEARILAVRAAREKAELLAKELGVRVGKPFIVRESPNDWYFAAGNTVQNSFSASGNENTNLTAGMIEISAQVEVSFRLISE